MPPQLNLLTSAFQTVLPRSLLQYRYAEATVVSPPKFTSSTTFYTGVTVGSAPTPISTSQVSPITPPTLTSLQQLQPTRMTPKRRYGQKERESSDDESDSSGATITRRKAALVRTSPMSPVCYPLIATDRTVPASGDTLDA